MPETAKPRFCSVCEHGPAGCGCGCDMCKKCCARERMFCEAEQRQKVAREEATFAYPATPLD